MKKPTLMMERYWLARFYGCDPAVFLKRSAATIRMHVKYTDLLMQEIDRVRDEIAAEHKLVKQRRRKART